jgi:hypothetical protein
VICFGNTRTMPELSKLPAAERVDTMNGREIVGLS